MPNRPLYIITWSDKWPNTLTSVRKVANVVGNWPVADCYFELCSIIEGPSGKRGHVPFGILKFQKIIKPILDMLTALLLSELQKS